MRKGGSEHKKKNIEKTDNYHLIDDLPTDLDMRGKPIKIQKLYGTWFAENKDKRIGELINVVKSTKGYEDWNPNFTKDSLVLLGKWLKENITSRKLTDKEYREKRSSFPDYIKVTDWDLTYRSRSLLYDTAVYFGETFIGIGRIKNGLLCPQRTI